MKPIKLAMLILLTAGVGQALAQCPTAGALNRSQIRNALGGNWACAKDGSDMWNEQIPIAFSGTFKECHSGLTTGPDPVDNSKGTFTISNNTGGVPDTITYTYPPSGGSYEYRVYEVVAGSTYTFCRVSDVKNYTVRIATCPPSAPNTCP